MQMTIRNIPPDLRKSLERLAKQKDVSLNQAALEAMMGGVGLVRGKPKRDLSDIFGSMTKEDVRALDKSVAWSDAASIAGQIEDEQQRRKDASRAGHKSVSRSRRRSA